MLNDEGFWYVATPYSKYPQGLHAAYMDANEAAARLVKRYNMRVFCPIGHSHSLCLIYGTANGLDDHVAPEFWKSFDAPFLAAAYGVAVIMMDSWERSAGVAHEIEFAKQHEMPIRYYDWPSLKLAAEENAFIEP